MPTQKCCVPLRSARGQTGVVGIPAEWGTCLFSFLEAVGIYKDRRFLLKTATEGDDQTRGECHCECSLYILTDIVYTKTTLRFTIAF